MNAPLSTETSNGWQPIDSAPHDSKTIIVCSTDYVGCAYRETTAGVLVNAITGRPFLTPMTHWMPLPEPPK